MLSYRASLAPTPHPRMRHGRSHVAGKCPCSAYADDMLMKPSDLVLLMLWCCTEGRKSSTDQLPALHSLRVVCVCCTHPAACAAFCKGKTCACVCMLVHVVVVVRAQACP